MRPQFDEGHLDAELVFDRFLAEGDDLDRFQELLRTLAPKWCSKLRIHRGPRDQQPIDADRHGALEAAILAAAGERGATYRAMVEHYGRGPLERFSGSAELRGAGPELTVVVSLDKVVVSPLGAKQDLGNSIALQVRRPRVERRPSDEWTREAFRALCAELSPAWGQASHPEEYWAKVMSETPRIEAVGRDLGRHLPGLFWLNFFGRRLVERIGAERLRSAPATAVDAADDGFTIEVGSDPWSWDTGPRASEEQRVRDHLGAELFFSKTQPASTTARLPWAD